MVAQALLTSSTCTGAYTAEMALSVVHKTIKDSGFFEEPIPTWRNVSCHEPQPKVCALKLRPTIIRSPSKELDEHCRGLIRGHHLWCQSFSEHKFPAPCCFGDIEHCLPPGSYNPEDSFMWKAWAISQAPLLETQHCFTHGRPCELLNQEFASDMEVAGLPCWDHSHAGKQEREHGRTNTVFMSHAKLHRAKATPLLVLENVQAGACGVLSIAKAHPDPERLLSYKLPS